MATNPASPEISGPCKHKLSTKATTNGDPQVVQKTQKSGKLVKKSVTTAPPKKGLLLPCLPKQQLEL